MADPDEESTETRIVAREVMPFVAPCRTVKPLAPFGWLKRGMEDLRAAPKESLLYGLAMAGVIAVVSLAAWAYGTQWLMLAMVGGFVFLAPLFCIGLYAISAQIERGQPVSLPRTLRAALKRHFGNEMIFAIVLLVIFMIWARAGMMLSVLIPADGTPGLQGLSTFLAIGTLVGAFFAVVTFTASAFSLPMIMHRDVDTVTAIVTSINAVLRNKAAMAVWMSLIILGLALGIATAFLGLIVVFPASGLRRLARIPRNHRRRTISTPHRGHYRDTSLREHFLGQSQGARRGQFELTPRARIRVYPYSPGSGLLGRLRAPADPLPPV